MTAPMRSTPRLSAVPAPPSTAPVAEFRCLFTNDIRRKQKRWQDGYLKFHTFNSRVIVYDTSRFVVGETYYKDSDELHEGDELTLDKGVKVEVAEAVGITQTDLTPLFERKTKDSPQRSNASGPQKPLPRPAVPASNPPRAASQLRHKSLNALLGTPRGPIGKAVPMRSPYQERQEKENQLIPERASKRQKTTHEAQQAPNRKTDAPVFARPLHANNARTLPGPPAIPPGATVISLSSEADNFSSDVTLPCTPSKPETVPRPQNAIPVPSREEPLPQQTADRTTPKLPKGKVPVPHVKAQQTPRPPPQPSSPPVSASNRIANVDFALQPLPKEPSPVASPPRRPQPLENRKTKSLRLSTGVQRGMLLCQAAPNQRQTSPKEVMTRTSKPAEGAKDTQFRKERTRVASRNDDGVVQSRTVRGNGTPTGVPIPDPRPTDDGATTVEGERPAESSFEISDDMGLVHGLMDEQLRVTPPPPGLCEPTESPTLSGNLAAASGPRTKASKRSRPADETPPRDAETRKKRAKATQPSSASKPPKKKKADKRAPVPSPPPSPARASNPAPPKDIPLLHPDPAHHPAANQPQTTSAPISPTKLAALSTGGFKTKPRRTQAQPSTTTPAPRAETVALPPHPLRSAKNGPLMSTTELAALLTKGPKAMRLEDDPIEDGDAPPAPARNATRARSENDAPIPSASADWEERNLRKAPNGPTPAGANATAAQPAAHPAQPRALAALVRKTDPRQRFKRAQRPRSDAGVPGGAPEDVVAPPPPPVDTDVGPWSTEAFDLFDWRPPGGEWRVEGGRMRMVGAGGLGGGDGPDGDGG